MDIDIIQQLSVDTCKQKNWKRDWLEVGCYLHLEVSEFVEAMRGKQGPVDQEMIAEAGDVLFVLLSTLGFRGILVQDVLDAMVDKMRRIQEANR